MFASHEASGIGGLLDRQKRIGGEPEAATTEACGLVGHSPASVACRPPRSSVTALGSSPAATAPALVDALLEVAGGT